MLIGIDASRATSPTPTGTEYYSRELIRALLALDPIDEYRLYTRLVPPPEFINPVGNAQVRTLYSPRLWTYARLAPEMLVHPPDVLFVPAHVLPPIHPRRSLVTIHDLGHLYFPEAHPWLQRKYHEWATRWNCRQSEKLLADSEATRDDIIKLLGIDPDRIVVVYPSFDPEQFYPERKNVGKELLSEQYGIAGDYVLAIGTIQPRKNYARLIDAFGRLTHEASGTHLDMVIVGRHGWLDQPIMRIVQGLKLEGRVHFLDYVPASDLPALVGNARLLAFPSLHEGFGIPVLEAQACGTPVVCSMTSSLPEAAGDGALFVDPMDVEAICAAMDRVLTDESIRNKIIANGFENVRRFSWQNSARKVLEVIKNLE